MFAVRSFIAALRNTKRPTGPLAQGLGLVAAGRFDEAEVALRIVLAEAANDRERAIVHNKRGVAYVGVGRRDDALAAFASALECDGACAPALANVGNLLLEDGHTSDAIDYYDAAIAADEGYALAHRNLGIALRRAGRRGESVSALRKADRLEARPLRRRA